MSHHQPAVSMIAVDAISPSGTNPRKKFDPKTLGDLVESVQRHGVLQPILIRPFRFELKAPTAAFGWRITRCGVDFREFPKSQEAKARAAFEEARNGSQFQLVAGERRWMAAKQAALPAIPAIVRDLDDRTALEIQVIENLQRADLEPMEEAEGYEKLIKTWGYTADDLAAKVGKSKGYIYGRLKLLALLPAGRKALAEGRINPSVALLLARIADPKSQEDALHDVSGDGNFEGPVPEKRARAIIHERYMLQLKGAPFDIKDATLVAAAGPCTTCPKRSTNQRELFSDIGSADVCTDAACFAGKKAAAVQARLEKAQQAGATVLSAKESAGKVFDKYGRITEGYVDLKDRCEVLGFDHDEPWRKTLGKKCPEAILAVAPDGEIREVLPRQEAIDALKETGRKPKANGNADYRDESAARTKKKQAMRAAVTEATPQILGKLGPALVNAKASDHAVLWRLVAAAAFGMSGVDAVDQAAKRRGLSERINDSREALEEFLDKTGDAETLIGLTVELLLCCRWSGWDHDLQFSKDILAAARLAGVDLPALYKERAKEKTKK